ncbi:protein kinase domain-containing protein [Tuwongella immobilis]|uniref:Protein kinase domain-containing protein n=1 Tax=Tuwongella immobilis TaxID=692036 RepID=A0A6C2YHZ4_9BACT|nr:protein kinase [Tuwongella immobilis]VIP01047.1 serine threonine protein kinase with pasta sensor : Serine/threonine protein kinase OS=Planctomyces maris DSM 8797 GN=PM8797T_31203 PE=3 SV=1: Pkinase [Tuwongella immobilis]VTR97519.1 serine threonine protein kinase with pasta sensor : Serine/threonine protein kinase OS=Planctomyces maris DSM 8797 GN=PM8797T_31203 PE=3 SV=1: Pkinase [Tuwongella immobilis]
MSSTFSCPDDLLLRAWRLGTVPVPARQALDLHLSSCPACRARLGQLLSRSIPTTVVDARTTPTVEVRVQVLASPQLASPVFPAEPATWELHPTEPPTQLGRYQVGKLIATGGFGLIYQAYDPQLCRMVAAKIPRYAGAEFARKKWQQDFLAEAQRLASIHHPYICPIYDIGLQDDLIYVIMPLFRGASLAQVLESDTRLPLSSILQIFIHLLEALQAVHRLNLIHRDLKPANIVFDEQRRPCLTDFGLACQTTIATANPVNPSSGVGTPAYMAPEQRNPRIGPVSVRTDLYSLARIIVDLLDHSVGKCSQEGYRSTLVLPSQIPPGLDWILQKALNPAIEQRFASAEELLQAVQGWMLSCGMGYSQPSAEAVTRTFSSQVETVPDLRLQNPSSTAVHQPIVTDPKPNPENVLQPSRVRIPFFKSLVIGSLMLTVLVICVMWLTTSHEKSRLSVAGKSGAESELGRNIPKNWEVLLLRDHGVTSHPLELDAPGALPARAGDRLYWRLQAQTPLYWYVVWIGRQQSVVPLFPWRDQKWDATVEIPSIYGPSSLEAHQGWPLPTHLGSHGTLVVWGQKTPRLNGRTVPLELHKIQELQQLIDEEYLTNQQGFRFEFCRNARTQQLIRLDQILAPVHPTPARPASESAWHRSLLEQIGPSAEWLGAITLPIANAPRLPNPPLRESR